MSDTAIGIGADPQLGPYQGEIYTKEKKTDSAPEGHLFTLPTYTMQVLLQPSDRTGLACCHTTLLHQTILWTHAKLSAGWQHEFIWGLLVQGTDIPKPFWPEIEIRKDGSE